MQSSFRHEALFYEDADRFLEGTLPFIRDGLADAEPVLVALAEDKLTLLRDELGADAASVEFVDMGPLGRNPARIIPVWREFVARAEADGATMRGIGEPAWPGRSSAELIECDHHESLLNLAFAEAAGFTLLCPYDAAGLDGDVLAAARRNHPVVVEQGEPVPSRTYLAPEFAPRPLEATLPPAPAEAHTLQFASDDLARVRGVVAGHADTAGIERERLADLVLSVNELASNSMRHGGGEGLLRVWSDDVAIHCEIADAGRFQDPLLGRTRPSPAQEYGRGLWLVHQLCDLVHLRSGPAGTLARVSMARV